jgi:hypothetical protein
MPLFHVWLFGAARLRINRQTSTHSNEPANAEIKSSNVILISPRPRLMPNNAMVLCDLTQETS